MTGTMGIYGNFEKAAELIRQTIKDELGFTVNIGISENKSWQRWLLILKSRIRYIHFFRSEIEEKMWPLSVDKLFFAGKAATGKLS
jgi:DNA polymerase-4